MAKSSITLGNRKFKNRSSGRKNVLGKIGSSNKRSIAIRKLSKRGFKYPIEDMVYSALTILELKAPMYEISGERIKESHAYTPQSINGNVQLHNRRYIGSKYSLINWIFSVIERECQNRDSFVDIFAGTGVVAAVAAKHFKRLIINDFLHSNFVIYNAFFGGGAWNQNRILDIISHYNNLQGENLSENYFSAHYGGKYFSVNSARIIGFIREDLKRIKEELTQREYYILLASLLYSVDKIANTVGHYDAFFKRNNIRDVFIMKPITPLEVKEVSIFREDANLLAKKIKADVVYIDPPYNSRQYSRFYHVLETLIKWDNPTLYGVALKPDPENMSDYCRVQARNRLAELVEDLKVKHIVVSYNNTYESKSNSSKNKINLAEINDILNSKGKTNIFEKEYRHFNAGNTEFKNHKEYLFVTKVNHA